jgi:hypothetical protein
LGGRSERYDTTYSFESCWPIAVKIGSSCSGVALSTNVPPVALATVRRVCGSYSGDCSPTEMTRTFASLSAASVSSYVAWTPRRCPSERSTAVVRSYPASFDSRAASMSAS